MTLIMTLRRFLTAILFLFLMVIHLSSIDVNSRNLKNFTVTLSSDAISIKAGNVGYIVLNVSSNSTTMDTFRIYTEELNYACLTIRPSQFVLGPYDIISIEIELQVISDVPIGATENLYIELIGNNTGFIWCGNVSIRYLANAVFLSRIIEDEYIIEIDKKSYGHIEITNVGNTAGEVTLQVMDTDWSLILDNSTTPIVYSLQPEESVTVDFVLLNNTQLEAGRYIVTFVVIDTDDKESHLIKVNVTVTGFVGLQLNCNGLERDIYAFTPYPDYATIRNPGNTYLYSKISIELSSENAYLSEIYIRNKSGKGIDLGPRVGINLTNTSGSVYLQPNTRVYYLVLPPFSIYEIHYTVTTFPPKNNTTLIFKIRSEIENEGIHILGNGTQVLELKYRIHTYNITVPHYSVYTENTQAGMFATFKLDIANNGSLPINGLEITLLDNGITIDSKKIDILNPMTVVPVSFTFPLRAGIHNLIVAVSPVANRSLNITLVSATISAPISEDTGGNGMVTTIMIHILQGASILLAIFLFIYLILLVYHRIQHTKSMKSRANLGKIIDRYRQHGEPPPGFEPSPDEYDGGKYLRRYILPELDKEKPWTHCLNCGEILEYPDYICHKCGANMREYYAKLTKTRCVWCDTEIDSTWMDIIEKCDGLISEDKKCDAGPFCSLECLEDHKQMAPHYHPIQEH